MTAMHDTTIPQAVDPTAVANAIAVPRIELTEDQLSMVASAIAGGQPMCCIGHDSGSALGAIVEDGGDCAREALSRFANEFTGCQLGKLSPEDRAVRIERYLTAFMKWEVEIRP